MNTARRLAEAIGWALIALLVASAVGLVDVRLMITTIPVRAPAEPTLQTAPPPSFTA